MEMRGRFSEQGNCVARIAVTTLRRGNSGFGAQPSGEYEALCAPMSESPVRSARPEEKNLLAY